MAKLSDEEAAQLKALREKEEAPDEPEGGEGEGGYGDGVIVLVGNRADSFLEGLFGSGKPAKKAAAPAKKTAPAKKAAPGKAGQPPADDDDEGDEDEDPGDPPPPHVNRFFR